MQLAPNRFAVTMDCQSQANAQANGGEVYCTVKITPWFHLALDPRAIETEIGSPDAVGVLAQ